jgi:hypothetical protein
MMTCAHAFIQSDERNIAIAHVSKLEFGFWKSELFFKNKTAAFAFNQRIDTIGYSLSYVI